MSAYFPALNLKDAYAFLDHIFEGKILPHHLVSDIEKEKRLSKILNAAGIPHKMDVMISLKINFNTSYKLYTSEYNDIKDSLISDHMCCPSGFLDFYGCYANTAQSSLLVLPFRYYTDHIEGNESILASSVQGMKTSEHCLIFIKDDKSIYLFDMLNIKNELKNVKCLSWVFLHIFMFFYIFLCVFTYFYVFLE